MKNRYVAAILAFFLGGLGIHKFYLGKNVQGIIYLVFCWTYIPAIIAFVEGIMYLTMGDAKFNAEYGNGNTISEDPIVEDVEFETTTSHKPGKNRFLPENSTEKTKKCPNCGAENSIENNFCESCGTKL
ncbi:MAG: NINE protein [Paludibacteraceae bacterium]|nr:NINE protein [Paludibacteraceae bacterium]